MAGGSQARGFRRELGDSFMAEFWHPVKTDGLNGRPFPPQHQPPTTVLRDREWSIVDRRRRSDVRSPCYVRRIATRSVAGRSELRSSNLAFDPGPDQLID